MQRFFRILLAVIVPLSFAVSPERALGQESGGETGRVKPVDLQESFTRIAENVRPAVVNVATVYVEEIDPSERFEFFFGSPFEDFFGEQEPGGRQRRPRRRLEGTGSGVIISADGYVLTNEHVVRDAEEITVTLDNEKRYRGKVIGRDPRTDIAVIKINAGEKLPFVTLGDSDKVRVGEWVAAIGSPFGLQATVTSGIVSAVRQSLPIEGAEYRDMIQTDAPVNQGNSGGPLCNMRGEVIGINTAIFAPTGVFAGVGFALPINTARGILDELIKKGRVVRGWLGVEIQPVNETIARQFNLPDRSGALVNNVVENSPAAKAGLRRGDVLRQFSGRKINGARDLQAMVAQTRPGTKTDLTVIRNGKEVKVPVTVRETPARELAERPAKEKEGTAKEDTIEWAGMRVASLTREIAAELGMPREIKGVVVVDVRPTSSPGEEEMEVQPGDIIQSVNRMPTPSLKEFRSVTKKADISKGIVLDINRQGKSYFLTYRPRG